MDDELMAVRHPPAIVAAPRRLVPRKVPKGQIQKRYREDLSLPQPTQRSSTSPALHPTLSMPSPAQIAHLAVISTTLTIRTTTIAFPRRFSTQAKCSAHLRPLLLGPGDRPPKTAVITDSLKLLEWDKLCDAVSSFAGTFLGREATKAQLWSVDVSYEKSKKLLDETSAAVELITYGAGGVDFAGVDVVLVKSAIDRAARGLPVDGLEAMALVNLIQFAETLQVTVKTAVKEDADWYHRFMPLTEVILDSIISRSFVKLVQQVIEEDGSVKDSASPELKRSRDHVQALERKLYQLLDKLIRNERNEASQLDLCTTNGRWCIRTTADQFSTFDGLLLSSGAGVGGLIEPIAAVPLNDELQQARALVTKAEEDVLSRLTDKMQAELGEFEKLLDTVIRLDAIFARAKYSVAYGATYPDLFLPGENDRVIHESGLSSDRIRKKASFSHLPQCEWKLFMARAYHPLMLQKHSVNLHDARKDVASAVAETRRRKFMGRIETNIDSDLASLKQRVAELEESPPVPVDFKVSAKTAVLVITGPNTGGKTISLKTLGLASLMAKTGLYVLASEPVKIPWFDGIFADIGDEQSLTQSLSTFSGHLKQISAIRSQSSHKSLVLLDEVGAGTNPLEGAALGMSLLESFAEIGSFLTIATTHLGELKTLKYSNYAFENACVEFDENTLKPTYKILWGVPGRSNAINIAERLGLPKMVLDKARKLHGVASAEINEVIFDMERYKQDFQHDLQTAKHFLMLSRKLSEDLTMAKQRIRAHTVAQVNKKAKLISDTAALARSILRDKLQQFKESALIRKASENDIRTAMPTRNGAADTNGPSSRKLELPPSNSSHAESIRSTAASMPAFDKRIKTPKVGDLVNIPSLGKQGIVLRVEASKGEVLVQASNIKLRLRMDEIVLKS